MRGLWSLHTILGSRSRTIKLSVLHPAPLRQKQSPRRPQQQRPDDRKRIRPPQIVMLPIRHPIPLVPIQTKNNHRDEPTEPRNPMVQSVAHQQNQVFIVVAATEAIKPRQRYGDQHQSHTQSEEKLRCDEKRRQQKIVYYVIFLLEDPPAPGKLVIVVVPEVLEILEAHLPQP